MYLENVESVFEQWDKFTLCFNGLEDIKSNYKSKLEELALLHDDYTHHIAARKCQLGLMDKILNRINVPEEQESSVANLKKQMDQSMQQLVQMEDDLRQEVETKLETLLGNITITVLTNNDEVSPLCQLCPSLLEHIALCLPNKSIEALKCSSDHLNSALDTKRVWKKLLYYDERYYESDLLSGSTTAVEAVNKLRAGVGRYQVFYELQQARSKLSKRDFERFDEIRVPAERGYRILEFVCDDGQRWIFVRHRDTLLIWNITSTPAAHDTVQLPPDHVILSLPSQGYMVILSGLFEFYVYKFQKPDYKLEIMYRLLLDENNLGDPTDPLPPNQYEYWDNNVEIAVKDDLIIVCHISVRTLEELTNTSVHIWKVSTGEKLAKVGLNVDIMNKIKSLQSNIYCLQTDLTLDIVLGHSNSSSILITFSMVRGHFSAMFSLKTFSFTHVWPEKFDSYEVASYIYADKVCFRDCSVLGFPDEVSVYSIQTASDDKGLQEYQHMKTFYLPTKIKELGLSTNQCIFVGSKVILFPSKGVISIVSLEDNSLPEVRVTVAESLRPCGFIEPHLLLLYDKNFVFVVYNIISNTILYNSYVLVNHMEEYWKTLTYPTKIPIAVGNSLKLYC